MTPTPGGAGTLQIREAAEDNGDPVLVIKDAESMVVIEFTTAGVWREHVEQIRRRHDAT